MARGAGGELPQVSTLARGLLPLLGLQNFGENPRFLSDVIAPSLDLFDMLAVTARTTIVAANVAAAAVGGIVFPELLVPAGELWWVEWYNVRTATLGAGAAIRLRPSYTENSLTSVVLGNAASAAVGEQARPFMDRRTFVVAGGQLSADVEALTAGPVNVSAAAIVARFRI